MILESFAETIFEAFKESSLIEWVAIITALLYVILAARINIWCWLFGIISAGLYIYLNYSVKLYLDALLSVYYVVIGFVGWYSWKKSFLKIRTRKIFRKIKLKEIALALIFGIVGTLLLGKLSAQFSDSPLPYFDAALTSFSLVATYLTTRKILENWIFWILIDAAYVIIYWMRALPSTSILFLIYTFIAIYGYIKWRKNIQTSEE